MKTLVHICALTLVTLSSLPQPTLAKSPAPEATRFASTVYLPNALTWDTRIAYRSASLRVVGPGGFVHDLEFGAGQPVLDLASLPALADGQYKFEVVFGRRPDAALAKALSIRDVDEGGSIGDPGIRAQIDALRETVSGSFRVMGGRLVAQAVEPLAGRALAPKGTRDPGSALKDIIHPDDVIIQGSLCVGIDCVDGEVFGFDTIRLKENNLRIKFEDTSLPGFPTTDWQLTANESAAGGLNKFSIEDITAATVPFTVEGGAGTNSLYVGSTGRIGLGTNAPLLKLHQRQGDTPAIRMEQDSGSGFTAQTWDIGANEANFFVRDLTSGSRLPFRIRPGAPTSSIDISPTGNIGVGTGTSNLSGAARALTIATPSGGTADFAVLELHGSQSANTAAGAVRFYNKTNLVGQIAGAREGADNTASLRFLTTNAGSITEKVRIMPSGRVGIGTQAPASTLHVVGDATITGALHVSGPCCGPDYVFDPGFKLASIEESAAYMWKHRHLPAVGPARTTADGRGVVDVFAQSNGMLEELEKAHIYIGRLHGEIQALKAEAVARDAALREQLGELRRLLGK